MWSIILYIVLGIAIGYGIGARRTLRDVLRKGKEEE